MSLLSLGLDDPGPEHPIPEDETGGSGEARPFAALQPPPLRARPPAVIFSGIVHLLSVVGLLALLRASVIGPPPPPAPTPAASRVFLPPTRALRALLGLPPLPPPRPPQKPRDRISIGAPSPEKHELVLRPEDDLTKAPKGDRMAQSDIGQVQPDPIPETPSAAMSQPDTASGPAGRDSLRPRLQVGGAIARALAAGSGRWGDPTGDAAGMGLQFDPEGADFSRWMQHFKNEVYRNWIVPQSALWGWGGQVSFEFVVERGGAMTSLANISGSGTAALDRAAQNALSASRLLPLPDDFAPAQVTMRVTFNYGPPSAARTQARGTHP